VRLVPPSSRKKNSAATAVADSSTTEDEEEKDDIVTVPGLDSLVSYIEMEHAEAIATARSNVAAGLVDFDSLQEYFVPGRRVVDRGVATGLSHVLAPTILKVRACYYARGKTLMQGLVSSFHMALETVVAAGDDNYIVVEFQHLQSHFDGTRSISASSSSIDMFTLPSDPLLQELTRRGQQYQILCGGDHDVTKSTTGSSGQMVQYSAGSFLSVGSSKASAARQQATSSRSGGRMMIDTVSAWAKGVNCAVHNGTASGVIVSSLKMYQQTRIQKQQQRSAAESSSLEYSTATTAVSSTNSWAAYDGDNDSSCPVHFPTSYSS
jgi:hypothetical protein